MRPLKHILGSWVCIFRSHVEVRSPLFRPWFGTGRGIDVISCSRCGMFIREEIPTEKEGAFMFLESTAKGRKSFESGTEDSKEQVEHDPHGQPLYKERYKERKATEHD